MVPEPLITAHDMSYCSQLLFILVIVYFCSIVNVYWTCSIYSNAHIYDTIHDEKVRTDSVEKQILVYTMVTKFEIEKFNGNNFFL